MRIFIIFSMILAIFACATTNPQTDAEWNEFFSRSENALIIDQMKYEPLCNQLTYLHVWGQLIDEMEKKKGSMKQDMVYSMGLQFTKRITKDENLQAALLEMFLMGYRGEGLSEAGSAEMKACLSSEWHRMEQFRQSKLKAVLDQVDRDGVR